MRFSLSSEDKACGSLATSESPKDQVQPGRPLEASIRHFPQPDTVSISRTSDHSPSRFPVIPFSSIAVPTAVPTLLTPHSVVILLPLSDRGLGTGLVWEREEP